MRGVKLSHEKKECDKRFENSFGRERNIGSGLREREFNLNWWCMGVPISSLRQQQLQRSKANLE